MKTLYVLACCLFLAAIAVDLAGKRCYSLAERYGGQHRRDLYEIDHSGEGLLSFDCLALGDHFTKLGVVMAAIGIVLWLASVIQGKRRSKRMWPVVPLVLLVAYVLLFFIAV